MNTERTHKTDPETWMASAQYEAGKIHGFAIGCLLSSIVGLIISGLAYAITNLPGW